MNSINFLNYFLAVVLSFSGLILGYAVSLVAKEELKDGKKYFFLLQNVLLALILFNVMGFFGIGMISSVLISLAVFAVLFFFRNFWRNILFYAIFGVVFFIASRKSENISSFIAVSALIFIYGFPTAALLKGFDGKIKGKTKILMNPVAGIFAYFIWFVLISIALYFSGL
ncbi:MAG TPA: hypothetical protein VI894_00250 [Candidatus Nanoarchaeia archaeon]|nr:hypothetical protein [Candidatus Nanoarchaeia archaeon]